MYFRTTLCIVFDVKYRMFKLYNKSSITSLTEIIFLVIGCINMHPAPNNMFVLNRLVLKKEISA